MTDVSHPTPELLAPVGDWDCLRAAAANGADAVYFGLPQFNARHRATNFAPDELPKILKFLHDRNVKGFVTLNTLIFADELPAVAEYVKHIAAAGADAVIVQDLGLVQLIKRIAPTLPVHASTQMTLTEPRGIEFARRLGVERVVLAREMSIDEIRKVTATAKLPVEVFVHGALCVAYSGQCLTSEALGGRSANRGQCAQACRLPYEMIVDGQKRDLGDRDYLLSPQDLAGHGLVRDLIDAGVISFKIEGRLKTAAYVAATTQTYRQAIDAACAGRGFTLPKADERNLAMTFSRGFTPGFLQGTNHQMLVQGRFPKSRGMQIGRVVSRSRRGIVVRLLNDVADFIKAGDGVVFDLGTPEEREPGGRVWTVRPLNEVEAELTFEDSVDLSAVPVGCRVWKTDDPALRKKLEQSFADDRPKRRVGITVTMEGAIGEPLRVKARTTDGHEVEATWPGPLAEARTQPLNRATAVEQFGRLTDTPFTLDNVEMNLPVSAMVPKSVLNDLRRQVVEHLMCGRARVHEVVEPEALRSLRLLCARSSPGFEDSPRGLEVDLLGEYLKPRPESSKGGDPTPRLTVLVRTLDQLDAVLASKTVEMVYCDFEDSTRYREAVKRAREANLPIGLATLRVVKPGEEGFWRPILSAAPDAVLVRNLASLEVFREQLPSAQLIGDFSLNVANDLAAALLIREGLHRLVPSYDLNWDQFAALIRHSNPDWFEPVVHQHMPMFHMEHCVFAAFLSTGKDFRDCGRPCDRHKVDLKDRVGAMFPVIPDSGCRNTVFNSVAQSAAEYLGRMVTLGLRRFRIDLMRETPTQVGLLLETYARIIDGRDDGRAVWRQVKALNQLGVTRGTLQLV